MTDDGFLIGELIAAELADLITRWGERLTALAAEGHDISPVLPAMAAALRAAADGFDPPS